MYVSPLYTIPTASLSTLYPHGFPCVYKIVAGDWLGLSGPGFLRLVTLPFDWAH